MDWLANIFNPLIDWCVNLINGFFGGLGTIINGWLTSGGITVEIPPNVYDILHELTLGIGYIIPVAALLPIPIAMISFYIAKLIFAVYQLIAHTIIKRVKLRL